MTNILRETDLSHNIKSQALTARYQTAGIRYLPGEQILPLDISYFLILMSNIY